MKKIVLTDKEGKVASWINVEHISYVGRDDDMLILCGNTQVNVRKGAALGIINELIRMEKEDNDKQ